MSKKLADMLTYSSEFDVAKHKHSRVKENVELSHEELTEKLASKMDRLVYSASNPNSAKVKKHLDKMKDNVVPVALQFLDQNPIPQVQGADDKGIQDQEIVIDDLAITKGKVDGTANYPFARYDDIHELAQDKDDKAVENKPRGRVRGRGRSKKVKETDYEVISDDLEPEEAKLNLSHDELFRYGTADPDVPPSTVPCSGCGAIMHCQEAQIPGFLPSEIFTAKKSLLGTRCQRCYVMQEYDIALKVSVKPEDYPKTLGHIYEESAVILLVVDLTDFPGSVWPGVMDLVGINKHVVIVGNKVDLMPQDSAKYLRQIENSVRKNFRKKCINSGSKPPKLDSVLISAKTGFNVEYLIDKIYRIWGENKYITARDLYIVGTTNVGKSSLFNILLDSDLCKLNAVNRIDKAMTSQVPGTTLNLLKFPLQRPDPSRLDARAQRLRRERSVWNEEDQTRLAELRKSKNRQLTLISQPVRRTFEVLQERKKASEVKLKTDFEFDPTTQRMKEKPEPIDPSSPELETVKWCHDTPGTVSRDQIINLLTQEEILQTLQSDLPLKPRTFILHEGESIFIGGLARLDIIKGPMEKLDWLLATVFTSDRLPINVVPTSQADEFYANALGSSLLKVPCGDEQRLADFPALEGIEMAVDGISMNESSCDIVFSSAGWISCAPGVAQVFDVKAWTPGGKGIFVREPAFLPRAVQLRGKRITKTPAYASNLIFTTKKS